MWLQVLRERTLAMRGRGGVGDRVRWGKAAESSAAASHHGRIRGASLGEHFFGFFFWRDGRSRA